MAKVSRIPLRNDVWERIFKLFVETTADLKDKKLLTSFIDDLYTPTEKNHARKTFGSCGSVI